jgi:hypothetical protein
MKSQDSSTLQLRCSRWSKNHEPIFNRPPFIPFVLFPISWFPAMPGWAKIGLSGGRRAPPGLECLNTK